MPFDYQAPDRRLTWCAYRGETDPQETAHSQGHDDDPAGRDAHFTASDNGTTSHLGFPGSLSVQGGSPSVLSGSGGTSTVVSEPVVISTGTLVACGHHYLLSMTSSGGGTYTDCEMGAMTDDVSAETNIGDTITISLVLPPNSCG